ncbi:MAG: 2OG-Fe(II) oxygenase [Myxococcota bacterium]
MLPVPRFPAAPVEIFEAFPRAFVLESFLGAETCLSLIEASEGLGFESAPITVGPNAYVHAPDLRNNTRVMVDDPGLAEALFSRIPRDVARLPGLPARPVGLNERFRIYRYDPGQFFDWHLDGAFVRSPEERSFQTFMVYLNEGFEGGQTDFCREAWTDPKSESEVVPRVGRGLAFEHRTLHRGRAVASGRKYVLRTDIMYRESD